MADYLLSEGYKNAAAAIIGSVLEDHLRHPARGSGIAVEVERDGRLVAKKADLLNAELCNSEVYGKLKRKAATTWLDLRNRAAHGRYNEYAAERV
jgi:hypothetical protein